MIWQAVHLQYHFHVTSRSNPISGTSVGLCVECTQAQGDVWLLCKPPLASSSFRLHSALYAYFTINRHLRFSDIIYHMSDSF